MAIAHVASVLAHSGNGTYTFLFDDITSPAIDTTGANLLIGMVSWRDTTSTTFTDSKGNAWNPLTVRLSGTFSNRLRYCDTPPTVGSGHTATASATNSRPLLGLWAFSGAHATPYHSENGATSGSATSIQPGSVTPPEDNCLIFTGMHNDSGPVQSISGYTSLTFAYVSNTTAGGGAYVIQTTAAAENPTWSWSGARECAATIAVFKAAAATVVISRNYIPVFLRAKSRRRSVYRR